MPTLARIRVHPIKALDPVELDRVRVSPAGGLDGDRVYAMVTPGGEYVNGKRTDAVHHLFTDVDLDAMSVTIGVREESHPRLFDLDDERDALADWLAEHFGYEVGVEHAPGGELTDSSVLDGRAAGATVVSTATLETVASWFDDLDVEGVRRRFRANLEVEGVEAFWEDRLAEDGGVRFRVGEVAFRGIKPVYRCVVPARDPETGRPTDGFRERFLTKREETFPAWEDRDAFEHFYALTVLCQPVEADRGEVLRVGDEVEVLG